MAKIYTFVKSKRAVRKCEATINNSLIELQFRNALHKLQMRIAQTGSAGVDSERRRRQPETPFTEAFK